MSQHPSSTHFGCAEPYEALLAANVFLQKKNSTLSNELGESRKTLKLKDCKITYLKHRIKNLENELFGKRSERRPTDAAAALQLTLALEELQAKELEEIEETFVTVPAHTRKVVKKNDDEREAPKGTFPEHLPRVAPLIIDCPPEGLGEDAYERIGQIETEMLIELPAQFAVQPIVRVSYKVKETKQIQSSPTRPHILGRCKYSEEFLALMIIRKFFLSLPLYRQSRIAKFVGVKLNRGHLSLLIIRLYLKLLPVIEALRREIFSREQVHGDETPTLVGTGKERKGRQYKKGYLWPFLAVGVGILYRFNRTRNKKDLKLLLDGFDGILISDALSIYSSTMQAEHNLWQLCLMHARRNFVKCESGTPEQSQQALRFFRAIYRVERGIKDGKKELSAEDIALIRLQCTAPVLAKFRAWLQQTRESKEAQTDKALKKACDYMLLRWDAVELFTRHGELPPDNGEIERAIRLYKMGLRNYHFHTSESGADAAAGFYSLIQSCEMLEINPYVYLTSVLKAKAVNAFEDADLTPLEWKKRYERGEIPKELLPLEPGDLVLSLPN